MIKIFSLIVAVICLNPLTAWSKDVVSDNQWTAAQAMEDFESCYATADSIENLKQCDYAQNCMDNADNGHTTLGMSTCFRQEAELWDVKLNQEYKVLMKAAKHLDKIMPEAFKLESGGRADSLLKAQRAWLQYRDAECFDEYMRGHPGSIKGIYTAICKQDLIKDRTIKLRNENDF